MIQDDAFEKIDNQFDLILIAAKEARKMQISNRHTSLINKKNTEKTTVIALRKIKNYLTEKKITYL